jgi:hypothetical protein
MNNTERPTEGYRAPYNLHTDYQPIDTTIRTIATPKLLYLSENIIVSPNKTYRPRHFFVPFRWHARGMLLCRLFAGSGVEPWSVEMLKDQQ